MAYEYEIDKILRIFNAYEMDEPEIQRLREYLWDVLDDFDDSSYSRGVDSVHMCCDDDCNYY